MTIPRTELCLRATLLTEIELDPANDNARRFIAEMEEELAAAGTP